MKEKIKDGRGGPRPGSGRKPLPKGLRRDRKVMSTFTDAEHRELEEAAGDEPIGTFVRRVVLRHLARRRRK